ncbi:MAG: hypothetical protein S4CHLAM45_04280 [Chlamydiales bacterium]|nr:hypothetical protein [Chlamydiales bacterium]MCH9619282.1 hypothetical protein [Chlamydiales bacterium]MCH9622544.1 hypothetical protein [Chlamydiales bacterium]
MTISQTFDAVYFVSYNDPKLRLDPIAIRPTFESHHVIWEDTGRGTSLNLKKINISSESKKAKSPEKIEIETKNGKHITLTKMTLNLFNEQVRNQAAGNPDFHSDSELQEYYLNTNFDYYGP